MESVPVDTAQAQEEVSHNFGEPMEIELQCSICNELFISATTLSCNHTFCRECITKWRHQRTGCPLCRQPISGAVRCIALDNLIDKMVENYPDDVKRRRQELKDNRQGSERKTKRRNRTGECSHTGTVNIPTQMQAQSSPPIQDSPSPPFETVTVNSLHAAAVNSCDSATNPPESTTNPHDAATNPHDTATNPHDAAPNVHDAGTDPCYAATNLCYAGTNPRGIVSNLHDAATNQLHTLPRLEFFQHLCNHHQLPGVVYNCLNDEDYDDDNDLLSIISDTSDFSYDDGAYGSFYGGYGNCFNCGRKGHWANDCPDL